MTQSNQISEPTALPNTPKLREASFEAFSGTARRRRQILLAAIPAALFLLFLLQFRGEWTFNPQYTFGWGVPILGTFLFWKRLADRPAPEPAKNQAALLALMSFGFFLWLPIRIVREANMDWRFLEWLFGAGVVLELFALAWLAGGRRTARHFAPPILFLLVAIPWPTRLENFLVQGLTGAIVKLAVEALRWMGIAAWGAGNTIRLPATTVGVEDACSGLRAFQGAIMCAIFFGELRRLAIAARAVLVGCGIALALIVNFARTLLLANRAAHGGAEAVSFWHDGAGIGSFAICFVALWFLTNGLTTRRKTQPILENVSMNRIPVPFVIAVLAWLLSVEAITALWYAREAQPGASELRLAGLAGFQRHEISSRTQSILRYNRGELFEAAFPDGSNWWIYKLDWDSNGPGAPLARFHSPEVCLPAAGLGLMEAPRFFETAAVRFQLSVYEWLGKPVYVFSRFSSASGSRQIHGFSEFDLTVSKRLSAALHGIRPGAQQVLQIVITGAASRADAEREFREFARDSIRT